MSELNRIDVDEFKKTDKTPLVIILDNVRSALNVGSAFRTSDAFLVEKIYLTGITAKPPHKEIKKSALGATESVAWEYVESTVDLVRRLQTQGYQVIPVEQVSSSTSLENFQPLQNEKYAFVFGNEVFGVKDEVVEMVEQCIEIPQFGTKHSLNISVSLGVVIWDFFTKIR